MTQRPATADLTVTTMTMRLVREAADGMSRPPLPDLRMHLISAHCSPAAAGKTLGELEQDHRYEHDGSCTIRNHGRDDLSWDPAKAVEVLDEALEEEL